MIGHYADKIQQNLFGTKPDGIPSSQNIMCLILWNILLALLIKNILNLQTFYVTNHLEATKIKY